MASNAAPLRTITQMRGHNDGGRQVDPIPDWKRGRLRGWQSRPSPGNPAAYPVSRGQGTRVLRENLSRQTLSHARPHGADEPKRSRGNLGEKQCRQLNCVR